MWCCPSHNFHSCQLQITSHVCSSSSSSRISSSRGWSRGWAKGCRNLKLILTLHPSLSLLVDPNSDSSSNTQFASFKIVFCYILCMRKNLHTTINTPKGDSHGSSGCECVHVGLIPCTLPNATVSPPTLAPHGVCVILCLVFRSSTRNSWNMRTTKIWLKYEGAMQPGGYGNGVAIWKANRPNENL